MLAQKILSVIDSGRKPVDGPPVDEIAYIIANKAMIRTIHPSIPLIVGRGQKKFLRSGRSSSAFLFIMCSISLSSVLPSKAVSPALRTERLELQGVPDALLKISCRDFSEQGIYLILMTSIFVRIFLIEQEIRSAECKETKAPAHPAHYPFKHVSINMSVSSVSELFREICKDFRDFDLLRTYLLTAPALQTCLRLLLLRKR